MVDYKLTFDPLPGSPTYGWNLVRLTDARAPERTSEFPVMNLGTSSKAWESKIQNLFGNWAIYAPVLIHVAASGDCSAWLLRP